LIGFHENSGSRKTAANPVKVWSQPAINLAESGLTPVTNWQICGMAVGTMVNASSAKKR